MSYYTTPPEPEYDHCHAHGCDIDVARGEEVHHCAHTRCFQKLCVGCVFVCADCGEDFCEQHTADMLRGKSEFAEYVCSDCQTKRPRVYRVAERQKEVA